MAEDEKKIEELRMQVGKILDKLTLQTFKTQARQIQELPIETEEELQKVVDVIFEKSINEPNFSTAYPLLCKELALMEVPRNHAEDGKKVINFRTILVTRCQVEFEKQDFDKKEMKRNEIVKKIGKSTNAQEKRKMQLDFQKYNNNIRMRSVQNVRFIGELFKQQMLAAKVMMRCLDNLLENKDEESLECLCTLLETIGEELEHQRKINLSGIFHVLTNISNRNDGTIRIRGMLKNVIQLRKNKWVKRENTKLLTNVVNSDTFEDGKTGTLLLGLRTNTNATGTFDQNSKYVKKLIAYLNDECTFTQYGNYVENHMAAYFPKMVKEGYLYVLDKSVFARLRTGMLFAKLINEMFVTVDDYCIGLKQFLDQVESQLINNSVFWDYLAEILVYPICEEALWLKNICELCESIIKQGHGSNLLISLFKTIVGEKGSDFLEIYWRDSGLSLNNFMEACEIDDFVENSKLEFLRDSDMPVPQCHLTFEQIYNKLKEFFNLKTPVDDIVNWITAYVGELVKENKFIQTLATIIFEDSISCQKLIVENLQGHYKLLQKYIDGNPDYELQCLYALQVIIYQLDHPKDLLLTICDRLYEDGIISEESFLCWKTYEHATEQEGTSVALKELTIFFSQIKENGQLFKKW